MILTTDTTPRGNADLFRERYASRAPLAASRWTNDVEQYFPFAGRRDADQLASTAPLGLHRMNKTNALDRMPFIENNPRGVYHTIVVDMDDRDPLRKVQSAMFDDHTIPEPNRVIVNRVSGHAHIAWDITAPVATSDAARLKPMEYLAAIERGFTRAVNGDPGYQFFMGRNPLHEGHETYYGRAAAYSMGELSAGLTKTLKAQPATAAEEIGLGRDSILFATMRRWAYSNRLKYTSRAEWETVCVQAATYYAGDFAVRMMTSRVDSVAKSVAGWTWRNMTEEGKRQWHIDKGRAGGLRTTETKAAAARVNGATQRVVTDAQAEELRQATAKQDAQKLGVAERTVRRYKAEPRAEYLNATRDRHEAVLAMAEAGLTNAEIAEQLNIARGTVSRLRNKPMAG